MKAEIESPPFSPSQVGEMRVWAKGKIWGNFASIVVASSVYASLHVFAAGIT